MRIFAYVAILFCSSVLAGEMHPSIAKSKAGDWTHYSITNATTLVSIETSEKFTVKKALPEKLLLEYAVYLDLEKKDKVSRTSDFELEKATFDLREFYIYNAGDIRFKEAEYANKGKGEEELLVAGKKLKTRWMAFHVRERTKPELALSYKIWFSDEVPITGMVKCEIKRLTKDNMNGTSVHLLKGFGVGK